MAVQNDLQASGSFFSAALREMSRLRLALLMVVFLGLQALTSVLNVPLGSPPDELAHLSYVGDAIRSPVLMPDYTNGTIIGDQLLLLAPRCTDTREYIRRSLRRVVTNIRFNCADKCRVAI